MNIKKEQIKNKIFLILYLIFTISTFLAAFLVITKRLNNAGFAVVPMLFGMVFGMLYRNSKKAMEENKH